jgi:hypothetical protein
LILPPPVVFLEDLVRLSIRIDPRPYVVFDSHTTTVSRALSILGAGRFVWAILQSKKNLLVLHTTEFTSTLERAHARSLLFDVPGLRKLAPSLVVKRRNAVIEMEALPPDGTTESRAVVAPQTADGEYRILGCGILTPLRKPERVKPLPIAGGGFHRIGAPAKKAAVKKAPAKRAVKKAAKKAVPERRRIAGREPLSFAFADRGTKPVPKPKPEAAKDYQTVDVFYATETDKQNWILRSQVWSSF